MTDLGKSPVTFRDTIHRLRWWMHSKGVPGADKIRIEIHFPDHKSQHWAACELMRETSVDALMTQQRASYHIGPIKPDRMEIEGVQIIFSNPDRWDTK